MASANTDYRVGPENIKHDSFLARVVRGILGRGGKQVVIGRTSAPERPTIIGDSGLEGFRALYTRDRKTGITQMGAGVDESHHRSCCPEDRCIQQ